jgi:hypothetical protein
MPCYKAKSLFKIYLQPYDAELTVRVLKKRREQQHSFIWQIEVLI